MNKRKEKEKRMIERKARKKIGREERLKKDYKILVQCNARAIAFFLSNNIICNITEALEALSDLNIATDRLPKRETALRPHKSTINGNKCHDKGLKVVLFYYLTLRLCL